MDYNVTTNRVVLNAQEARRLIEARDLLKHVTRLAGLSPLVGVSNAGDWAEDGSGGIDHVLALVDWPKPKETNVRSTTEQKPEAKEPAKGSQQSAEPLVK